MQTVSLFSNTSQAAPISLLNQSGGSREARMARNAGRLYTLTRKGAAGLNPAAVMVDIVCSLLDAAGAWLRYSAARQQTKALQSQLSALEHQLDNDLKQLNIERKKRKQQGEAFQQQVALKLDSNRVAAKQLTQQLTRYKTLLYRLIDQLEQQRQTQRGTLQEFARLEALTHTALRQLLTCTLEPLK